MAQFGGALSKRVHHQHAGDGMYLSVTNLVMIIARICNPASSPRSVFSSKHAIRRTLLKAVALRSYVAPFFCPSRRTPRERSCIRK
jgi:hypothetical protein